MKVLLPVLISGFKEAPREPSPPPPPVPESVADLPPPPPPTEQTQEPPAQPTKALPSVVSMFEKKAEEIAKTDNKRNKGEIFHFDMPYIARFPFVDWAELLKACHSMSRPSSPHEKSVK